MKIRKAKKEDLEKISDLFRKEFAKPPYNEKWTKKNSLIKIKKYSKEGLMFVLEINNKIAGFITGHLELWSKGKVGYIDMVAVDSKSQDKGYGNELLSFISKVFKDSNVKLIVLSTNPKSKAFKIYKRKGFDKLNELVYMIKLI